VLPGWLLSLLFHSTTITLLVLGSRYWHREPVGFGDQLGSPFVIIADSFGDPFLDGSGAAPGERLLNLRPGDPQGTATVADQTREDPATSGEAGGATSPNATTAAAENWPADAVASSIALPTSVQPLTPSALTAGYATEAAPSPPGRTMLGPGLSSSGDGRPDARGHIKGSGGGGNSNNPGGGGVPGTAFLGVRDQATRVVYAIDCSASMANDNAIRSAKAALVASLQSLTESQQFQIIFYNQTPNLMRLRNNSTADMAFATEVNKTLARQHIAGVEPDLGTDHLPALKMALRLGPEVIFFLTDADEPQLSAGELQELHRLNAGRTRIHTIEFGRGAELGETVNFLKKLATQNGGTYRYHDVRRIAMER